MVTTLVSFNYILVGLPTGIKAELYSDSSDIEDIEDVMCCGQVVWARQTNLARYWPAVTVSRRDVPEHLIKHLYTGANTGCAIVRWYPLERLQFSAIKINNISELAENRVDGYRAARSSAVKRVYEAALADLRGE